MSPTLTKPFHRPGWVYEEKVDGWRMVAYKDGTSVRLVSRAGKDHSRRFADLAAAIRALSPATLILAITVASVLGTQPNSAAEPPVVCKPATS